MGWSTAVCSFGFQLWPNRDYDEWDPGLGVAGVVGWWGQVQYFVCFFFAIEARSNIVTWTGARGGRGREGRKFCVREKGLVGPPCWLLVLEQINSILLFLCEYWASLGPLHE